MSDPTKLSDAELLAALNGPQQPSGVSGISDADLMKALGQPAPAAVPQPSMAVDVAKSAGSGVVRGVTGLLGLAGDMSGLLGRGADAAAEWITGERIPDRIKKNDLAQALGSEGLNRSVDYVAGAPVTSYTPQTTVGEYARTVGEFMPGAMLGPGGVAKKALGYGLAPALASEAAGQATKGSSAEPYARIAAALAASSLPSMAGRVASPMTIPPERQRMIDALTREGVPVTAGQATGSKPLLFAESALGDAPLAGGKSANVMAAQGDAFTDAAMRRAGASGPATAENLQANYKRLGDQFETLAGRNTLAADTRLGQDIGQTLREYDKVLPSEQRRIVGNLATEIVQKFTAGGGKMAGDDYQSIRSRLSKRAQNARGKDDDYADAVRGLRKALDDGMERSISSGDAVAWKTARKEYEAQKVLERASTGPGSDAALGRISPASLRVAASAGDRSGYARGQGQFAELARAGQALMTPLPNSGTAQRQLLTGGIGGGALTALSTGNIPLAVALLTGPGMAGRALYSRPAQSYLTNQRFSQRSPAIEQIAQALLAGRSASLPSP